MNTKELKTVLMQCGECGSEEVHVVVNEAGAIGLFCAKCLNLMGSFPAEYDDLYDNIKAERAEFASRGKN